LTLEAGRYVKALHVGSYRKVGDTYTRIREYAADQGLGDFKPYSIEFYLNDPKEVAEQELETEVLVPLI
jgi:effector-binding domain-containing protein